MGYPELQRLREACEQVRTHVESRSRSAVDWGRAWVEIAERVDFPSVLRDGKRVLQDPNSSTNDLAETKSVLRWLRRGLAYSKQAREIEDGVRDLYPLDLARDRLSGMSAEELFERYAHRYESEDEARAILKPIPDQRTDEPIGVSLDRSMMKNRTRNPDPELIRRREHARARNLFPELEVA